MTTNVSEQKSSTAENVVQPGPNGKPPDEASAKRITLAVYVLQAAGFLVGLSFIVAVVINYVKLEVVRDSWLESHFRWQIRTFWWSLLWLFVGIMTVGIIVGYWVLLANTVWVIYRIVRGWLRLEDGKAMYTTAET